jgi:acyl transferase domain-containing protein
VLLESAASLGFSQEKIRPKEERLHQGPFLLAFSAKHPEALRRMVADHESYLSAHPDSLQDMSYSLGIKREVLSNRAFCVTNGEESFELSRINKSDLRESAKVVFVFTGQGAQWVQMGRELIERIESFRSSITGMDDVLSHCPDPPEWKLIG